MGPEDGEGSGGVTGRGVTASACGCRGAVVGSVGGEVADRDGFVAVRAGAAWADPLAEEVAVRAALVTKAAVAAGRALVDDLGFEH